MADPGDRNDPWREPTGEQPPPASGQPPGWPAQPPPQQQWGAPPGGYPPVQQYPPPQWAGYQQPRPGTNGLAIASMVLGILWLYWVGSILALVFGYVARGQIKQSGQGGDGMAIAGIVLGWVGIGVGVFFMLFVAAVFSSSP